MIGFFLRRVNQLAHAIHSSLFMIRSARVWDPCQSIWSGRIAARANPFACHAIARPFNLGPRLVPDCCRSAPYPFQQRATTCRSTRAKRSITWRRSKAESSPSTLHFRHVRPRQQAVLIDPLVFMAVLVACVHSLLGYECHDCI